MGEEFWVEGTAREKARRWRLVWSVPVGSHIVGGGLSAKVIGRSEQRRVGGQPGMHTLRKELVAIIRASSHWSGGTGSDEKVNRSLPRNRQRFSE